MIKRFMEAWHGTIACVLPPKGKTDRWDLYRRFAGFRAARRLSDDLSGKPLSGTGGRGGAAGAQGEGGKRTHY